MSYRFFIIQVGAAGDKPMPTPDKDHAPKPARPGKPDSDDDSLTYRVPGGPKEGSVTIDPTDGTFTYRPDPDDRDPG